MTDAIACAQPILAGEAKPVCALHEAKPPTVRDSQSLALSRSSGWPSTEARTHFWTLERVKSSSFSYGFGWAVRDSRKTPRLFLSTIAVPVSTQAGMGEAGAVRQSLNSWTALWCKSSRNLRP